MVRLLRKHTSVGSVVSVREGISGSVKGVGQGIGTGGMCCGSA